MNILGFPVSSVGKESACNAGDLDLIPGLGRCPGEGKGYPLQYSGLENPMDSMGLQRVRHDQVSLTDSPYCLDYWSFVVQSEVSQAYYQFDFLRITLNMSFVCLYKFLKILFYFCEKCH